MKNISSLKDPTTLIGKKVQFKANCDFFPNFDTTVIVNSVSKRSSEILFHCKVIKNSKSTIIGSNMKGLKYQVIS